MKAAAPDDADQPRRHVEGMIEPHLKECGVFCQRLALMNPFDGKKGFGKVRFQYHVWIA